MSIETEKWGLDPDDGRIIVDGDGNPILACNMPGAPLEDDVATARAIAVLPEALALLKDFLLNYEIGGKEDAKMQDILRRAGVLK